MEYNTSYSIGLVEGYLESLVKSGEAGSEEVLKHVHLVESAYNEAVRQGTLNERKLREIQLNLDGYGKI